MRHRKRGRQLGRNSSHRKALRKNLALSLLEHGRIVTTREKAKFVQPFVEKLITLSKEKTDHRQKLVFSRIQGAQRIKRSVPNDRGKGTHLKSNFGRTAKKDAETGATGRLERRDRRMVKRLFDVIGPMFKERPGGYTRILRLPKNRLGDNASQVIFELVELPPEMGGEAPATEETTESESTE